MAQTADYLLLSPFCTADDIRCVANLQMCLKIRTFMKVAREKRPAWAVEKFIETSKAEIEVWHAHYDAMLGQSQRSNVCALSSCKLKLFGTQLRVDMHQTAGQGSLTVATCTTVACS